ncbi:hypothetical protein T484DRAFT_1938423 [Baffinella frigidus]|nr:hypothetical protein T484DRAFT_1938423 [Cryptophyta sp. CCMP2293]
MGRGQANMGRGQANMGRGQGYAMGLVVAMVWTTWRAGAYLLGSRTPVSPLPPH